MSFNVEITASTTPYEIEVGVEVFPFEVEITVGESTTSKFWAEQSEAFAQQAEQSALDAEVAKIEWRGDWEAGNYEKSDAVSHLGSSWIANKDTNEEPSLSADDWDLLASKGEKGEKGEQGEQGIQGEKGEDGTSPPSSYIKQSFTSQTSVTVTHNFGTEPIVQVYDESGEVIIPLSITHNSPNDFSVTFTNNTTGIIVATYGVLI